MRVTDFTDEEAKTKSEADVSFEELCRQIIDAPPVAYKRDLRWLKLGAYGDRIDNPASGCLRTNANLLAVSGCEVDYDLEEMTIDEAADLFRARGIRCFLYTTASHEPDKPRWRGLFPFSRERRPDERETYVARANGVLGGVVSGESFNLSQAFYAGRVAGVVFDYRVVDGVCIDEVSGLPEIGRPGGNASGVSGYTREAAYDDIHAGIELHGAINFLAMLGETREAIEAAMQESTAKADDPRRWEKRLAEIPRSIRGAERRRERETQKRLASVGVPPRYSTDKAAPRASVFETFTAASLAGKPIPDQLWLAEGMIPAGQPVLLSGDGGLGKSLIALQLAVAVAKGGQWLGMYVPQGPALYLSAEDETAELHRRITRITDNLEALDGLHIAPMAELDPLLVTPGPRGGGLNTTALYDAVAARVEELRPALVVLDSNADFFGGNEVVRSEVRWFIGQLRKLCHATGCTVLILSHPSVSGMQSGTGLSGSTHWNNSVRARLYLTRPGGSDSEYVDDDARTLEVMKNNRGKLGLKIDLQWRAGMFVNTKAVGPASAEEADAPPVEDRAEALFMDLLEKRITHNINVSHVAAAKAFSETAEARSAKVSKKQLMAARDRLIDAGRVHVRDWRNNGRTSKLLALGPHTPPPP